MGFESLPHPPYTTDLAPSHYYLFPDLKRWPRGRRFESNEEEWETKGYFGGFDKSYYLEGITKLLKYRWTRCIELKTEYIEK